MNDWYDHHPDLTAALPRYADMIHQMRRELDQLLRQTPAGEPASHVLLNTVHGPLAAAELLFREAAQVRGTGRWPDPEEP